MEKNKTFQISFGVLNHYLKCGVISTNYEKRLNNFGIYTVGQLAATPKSFLKKQFGSFRRTTLRSTQMEIDNTNIKGQIHTTREQFFRSVKTCMKTILLKKRIIIKKEMD